MELNNIRLSYLAIDELYKDALVYPANNPPVETLPPSTNYKFLGNNNRRTTIIVHLPGTAYLPDDQLSFLSKMLLACQMTLADIAIVNTATQPVVIATLRQQLHPKAVLLFGLEPVSINLPINFPAFRLQPYDDCTYLAAPPLHRLISQSEESRLLKSKLWVCLKSLFDV